MKHSLSRLIGTAVIGLLLLYTGCPEGCNIIKYNAAGDWSVTKIQGEESQTMQLVFSGSRSGGYLYWNSSLVGDYEYEDGTLTFRLQLPDDLGYETYLEDYTGSFEDKDHLSGAYVEYVPEDVVEGTWTAVRIE
jgi:hypothetical protein